MKFFQTSRRQPGRGAISVLFWWGLVYGLVHLIMAALYGLRAFGREHIPQRGAAIFIANHQSYFDPCVVGILTRDRPFSSLARASLFRNRLFGWLIRQLGAVPIRQGRSDAGALRTSLNELEHGRTVLLYPEGTRSPNGALQPFQRGVLLLIKRARVPVIPIALEGPYDIWPPDRSSPKLTGRILVKAGPPIDSEELLREGQDAALERLQRVIESMRLELRAELRKRSAGRFPAPGRADHPYWELEDSSRTTSPRNA